MSETISKLRLALEQANLFATRLKEEGFEVEFNTSDDPSVIGATVTRTTEERHDL